MKKSKTYYKNVTIREYRGKYKISFYMCDREVGIFTPVVLECDGDVDCANVLEGFVGNDAIKLPYDSTLEDMYNGTLFDVDNY